MDTRVLEEIAEALELAIGIDPELEEEYEKEEQHLH
jgi:hypothetical protein